jgi:L-cysteine S-thiosulfotransferase
MRTSPGGVVRQNLQCSILFLTLTLMASACSKGDGMGWLGGNHSLGASKKWTGEAIFIERCRDCHKVHENGGIVGPDLTGVGSRRDHLFLEQVIYNPSKIYPGTAMPPYDMLPPDQLKLVAGYLGRLQ